jgi:hypothetical protein
MKRLKILPLLSLLFVVCIGFTSTRAGANSPPPTSRPISVHNTGELNKLPNNLSNAVVSIFPGRYEKFCPKLLTGNNVVIQAADSRNHPILVIDKKDDGRWLYTLAGKNIHIVEIDAELPSPKGGLVTTQMGKCPDGIFIERTEQNQGNIFWGHGGDHLFIHNVENRGYAEKYIFADFDAPLWHRVIDQSQAEESLAAESPPHRGGLPRHAIRGCAGHRRERPGHRLQIHLAGSGRCVRRQRQARAYSLHGDRRRGREEFLSDDRLDAESIGHSRRGIWACRAGSIAISTVTRSRTRRAGGSSS